jgi:selenide, water dikinase
LLNAGIGQVWDERVVSSIGDDAAIIRVSDKLVALTTADFFTPIIDDPYVQGQIAACNSTNDVFAKGGLDIISVLALMAVPEDMPHDVQADMLRGFCDFCNSIKAPVVGGQTILCPWPILGGAITALAEHDKIVPISGARHGDRLVLTKPLGIQPIMEVLRLPDQGQEKMAELIPEIEISESIDLAVKLMTLTNRGAAEAMLNVGVNAATDITGFGILGHASNMAEQSRVSIEIHTLPVIKWTPKIAEALRIPLLEGEGVETSGGLLISVSPQKADQLLDTLERTGFGGYEIGAVEKGEGRAHIRKGAQLVEVSDS